ncbi:MAG: efflux RND transporter periplasmic adaptor subunit [Chitinivibrionales bacterium]|nr:efflux RND transporter periplasmic adaptor subunit [Chitinivibrionales bacterium]
MANRGRTIKYLIAAAIIAVAVVGTVILVVTRREPPRTPPAEQGVLVETMAVYPDTHQLTISAFGTVTPAREVRVVPQVSGRVVWVNDDFKPGGLLGEGDTLFIIDTSDYKLAVEEAQSSLEEARAQLELEKGQQEVARREWELFADEIDTNEANRDLALRRPQLESARAAVQAARAALERARLNLERTRLKAPFNGFAREAPVDVGQLLTTQSQAGVIVGTDTYWVRVALPEENTPYIDIPGVNADSGSAALIRHRVGGLTIERDGRVAKLLGDLEPAGRMARVLIVIDDPLGLRDVPDSAEFFLPLLVDAFVEVIIAGPREPGLYALPRPALRDGNQVYLFAPDSTLRIAEPDIAWRGEDTIYIAEGLDPGDRVITSPIAVPVEGMSLRRSTETDTLPPPPGPASLSLPSERRS